MNCYLFKYILIYINSYNNIENKNKIINEIEEYIEWLEYSKKRFNKDYSNEITILKDIQSCIVLNEYSEASEKIRDNLLAISLNSDEEDLA